MTLNNVSVDDTSYSSFIGGIFAHSGRMHVFSLQMPVFASPLHDEPYTLDRGQKAGARTHLTPGHVISSIIHQSRPENLVVCVCLRFGLRF